jgi:NADPH2:quinone reductase
MRAVLCDEYGSYENLTVSQAENPVPAAGQVLVEVHAASLNFPDLLVVQGLYQFKPEPPFIPGAETAGVIAALGEGVDGLVVGQKVASVGVAGGFAELRVVDADSVIPLADDADLQLAAATTMSYGTSYHALQQRAQLVAGETLLGLGAAGGVGSAAVEIGKAMGATVIAAASTDEKLAFCKELGADHTVNYTSEDLKTRVKELTGGAGVDVVYDPVGGDLTESAFRALAWQGRHLMLGFSAGEIPDLPMNLPLLKGASVVGVFWGSFTARDPRLAAENLAAVASMVSNGELRPRVTEVFSLDEIVDAYALLATRRAMGKVVIQVSGEGRQVSGKRV